MNWHRVVSPILSHVGYNLSTRTLDVRFNTGSIKRYLGVPRSVYAALIGVDSASLYSFDWIESRYPVVSIS